MLLANLLKEVKYGNSKKGVKYAEEIAADVNEFIDVTTAILKTSKTLKSDKRSELKSVILDLTEKFNNQIKEKDKQTNYLDFKPVDVIKNIKFDSYDEKINPYIKKSKVLTSFRTNISNVLDVAEKLGLVVIPQQYVKYELVSKEQIVIDGYKKNIIYAYDNFISEAKEQNLNTWLICPIQYYDIERHAKDLTYNFFIPSVISQAFTSIKIILPMLIGMIEQIESIKNQVDNINVQLENMKCTLKAQQQQIDRLETELVKERQRRVEESLKVKALEAEVAAQKAQINWSTFDPLQIALPNSVTDINTYNGNVVLGIAWGPEVDDTLVELLGMQLQETREDFVAKQYKRFG